MATQPVASADVYCFRIKGKAYTLPAASKVAGKIPAGRMIDAVMASDDMSELRLGLAMLMETGAPKSTLDAIRGMPMDEFTELLSDWMNSSGAPAGK